MCVVAGITMIGLVVMFNGDMSADGFSTTITLLGFP